MSRGNGQRSPRCPPARVRRLRATVPGTVVAAAGTTLAFWPPLSTPNPSFEARPNGIAPCPRGAGGTSCTARARRNTVGPASTRTLGLMNPPPSQPPPVLEPDEAYLARWLFTRSPVQRDLAAALQIAGDTPVDFQVTTSELFPQALGPGDIDVLLFNGGRAHEGIAIEVKRVKLPAAAFFTGMPGKVQSLRQGVVQANLLSALGLHRTMLLILIVTDGSEREDMNFASRGPTWELARTIDAFPDRDRLSPDVDLAFIEITQPTNRSFEDAAGVGIRLVHQGTARIQDTEVTVALSKRLTGSTREHEA